MNSESTEECAPAPVNKSEDESQNWPKIKYTIEFLLSLSHVCTALPVGFNASILSIFEDGPQSVPERQRVSGGLPLQKYGSTPLNRANSSSTNSRGSQGRWDTHSSGSNDKDGDSSDQDSVAQDSVRWFGNHSRRTWQHPEHDGLLGSGAFPRPSVYTGGAPVPSVQGNDHYLLNRSSEPYHPPRYYKAQPHSRQDATDSRNEETFGSAELSGEDRIEEERKRRESFELMRKEQHKALQEKQKHPDKHKELLENDIVEQLKNSEDPKNHWSQCEGRSEEHVSLPSVLRGDSAKTSFPVQAPPSRPLVPPGFATSALDKNLSMKSLLNSSAPMVTNVGNEDNELKRPDVSANDQGSLTEKQDSTCVHSNEQQYETKSVAMPFMDINERTSISSPDADTSKCSAGFEKLLYQSSNLLEVGEGWENSLVATFDTENMKRSEVGTASHDHSTSILDKLFNNALAINGIGSPGFVETNEVVPDGNAWSTSQDSKFAHWFLEEEKKVVDDDSSSKATDLLLLISSHDNIGIQVSSVSDEKGIASIPGFFTLEDNEVSQKFVTPTSMATTSVGTIEPFYHPDIPTASSGVLTCEDLEQSILAEVKDSDSFAQKSLQGAWNFVDTEVETQKLDVDDHASQHLLSLLQKGTLSKSLTTPTNLDMDSSNKHAECTSETPKNVNNADKTLTLETLFGSAFMKELHSVEAPVSVHRGPASGDEKTSFSETNECSYPVVDNGFGNHTSDYPNIIQVPLKDKIDGHWLSLNNSQSVGSKFESDDGFAGKADGQLDIRLPEEESLIAVGDPVQHEMSLLMPMGSAARSRELMSTEPPVEIIDKLAALSSILKEERSMVSGVEGSVAFHSPYGSLEHDLPYHLLGRPPPQFPQMNAGPPFHSPDPHSLRNQMKFIGPEGIHDAPQHAFQPNVHPHFHGLGGPRFDPSHHSAIPPGNFPPPQMLHGLPRGLPSPHPFSPVPGYLPEMNPFQGFPLNHQQANFGVLGMGLPGPGVGGGDYPEMLEWLIEMERRRNSKQRPPVAAGHGLGMCGPELDMAFRHW